MQDQGKRLLLAVALALGVFAVWSMVAKKDEPPKPPQSGSAVASGAGSALSAGPAPTTMAPVGPAASSAPGPAAEAKAETIELPFDHFVATFSSACGGPVGWHLTDPRYKRDATRGDLLPVRAQMTAVDPSGKPVPVPADQLTRLPVCGAFDVNFVASTSTYVVPRDAVWKGEKVSPTEIRYTYSSDALDIVKDFVVVPQDYLVRMEVKITVRPPEGSEAHEQLAVSAYAYQDPAELKNGSSRVAPRAWSSATLRDDEVITTDVSGIIDAPRFEPSRGHEASVVHWTGFDHPYILMAYAANEPVFKQTFASNGAGGRPKGMMQTDIMFGRHSFKRGESLSKTVVGYLGPKNYDDLERADATAGFHPGFGKVIDFGWFAFLGRPFLWVMQKFWSVVGNWGVSIILLTIVIKLATLYWTTKSMRSMKAVAALAPQIKALQAKYGDDKQRQQAETMALYKEHGVNPVAGCLPMMLQMPIWIALWRMLANAGELYQQPFIPGWIDDLTATDPVYVLPAILFISMFLQARLQPASADSTQQKLMQYGLPITFGVMAFLFPAGLTLYMLTNNILSALHSIYMNKFDKHSLASAALLKKNQEVVAAVAAAGGKSGAAKQAGKTTGAAAGRVIEAKATEVPLDGDDGDDDADAPDAAASAPGAGAARNRPRRKKRRR